MIKKTITYEDFDGNEHTEDFYFNLTKSELIELEAAYDGKFGETLKKIVEAEDNAAILREFKKIIQMSYGERSEDGKHFIKSEDATKSFLQHAAYSTLFLELAQDATAMAEFVTGIMPKGMVPDEEDISQMTSEERRKKLTEDYLSKKATSEENDASEG